MVACAQARKQQVAELKKIRQCLDPFQPGKVIDQKLERVYDMANRRLSPKATQESRAAHTQEKTQRSRRNGCGKAAPTAATTAGLRLHFQCLDGRSQGYIFKWLDTAPATMNAHCRNAVAFSSYRGFRSLVQPQRYSTSLRRPRADHSCLISSCWGTVMRPPIWRRASRRKSTEYRVLGS